MSAIQENVESNQATETLTAGDQPEVENATTVSKSDTTENTTENTTDDSYENREVVAEWRVPVRGKLHKIEFEHGTTSGKRVIWVNEKVRLENVFK